MKEKKMKKKKKKGGGAWNSQTQNGARCHSQTQNGARCHSQTQNGARCHSQTQNGSLCPSPPPPLSLPTTETLGLIFYRPTRAVGLWELFAEMPDVPAAGNVYLSVGFDTRLVSIRTICHLFFWGGGDFFFFFCVPQLYLWGSPLLGEVFAYVTVFFNPTIKVVTFRLRGWCVLGVFLLPAFTRLGHERQDLLSPCDEMRFILSSEGVLGE